MLLPAATCLWLSCGTNALRTPPSTVPDWPGVGGDARRTGAVGSTSLEPPLYLLWERRAGRGPDFDACLAGDGVLVASTDLSVHYLDLANGGGFWKKKLKGAPSTAPIVADDRVIVGHALPDPGLLALGIEDGAESWWRRDLVPYGGPVVRGGVLYVTDRTDGLMALDVDTGETRWSVELEDRWGAPLAANDDVVVVTGESSTVAAYATADGALVWQVPLESGSRGGATLAGDRVIAPSLDGTIVSLDVATGAADWRRELDTHVWAPVVIDGDEVFVTGSAGWLHVLDRHTGELSWSVQLRGVSRSKPAVAGDAVIVTTMTATCQIVSRSARRVIHTVDLKRPVRTAALVSGHVLIAVDDAGHVYAYESSNS